ncbi:MAG TPA: hypothetical protein VFN64_11460 [Burkholderiaceae bacterium]|nr:hypothetical protein [Burkholderiaceae bacterium]
MTNRTAPDLLATAAALVEQALGQLNDARRLAPCPTCGRPGTNRQMRVRENLEAVPERLRNAARRLSGEEEKLPLTYGDEERTPR